MITFFCKNCTFSYLLFLLVATTLFSCGPNTTTKQNGNDTSNLYVSLRVIPVVNGEKKSDFIFKNGRTYRLRLDSNANITTLKVMKGQDVIAQTNKRELIFKASKVGVYKVIIQSEKAGGNVILEVKKE